MSSIRWQFWIDVGGTFTDCIALPPEGEPPHALLRHKVLSSGVTKGHLGAESSAGHIIDATRCADPADFWRGYQLRLLDAQGSVAGQATVTHFDHQRGLLRLSEQISTQPGQAYELTAGEEAPILAIRYLLKLPLATPIPAVSIRLGTTRGTNALITRRGATTALVTTRGFGDILHIGYQNRPRLFDLVITKPQPLFTQVVEIDERVTADGEILRGPDRATIRRQLSELLRAGVQSLAICLMHAYRTSEHEELIEQLAEELGFAEISRSSRVAPVAKIVARGDTTVMDAYLNPVLRQYVRRLRTSLNQSGDSELRMLTSAGGLVDADHFSGKDCILSGPAGGVVGASRVAQAAGFERSLGFDMGGTSTDVSRFDGRFEFEYETEKSGVRIVTPMMAIETVAAGGGSICQFDGVKLAVGPDSASADPGPACYGRGGPLAVTDINFFLGRLLPEHFPFPLDRQATLRRLKELAENIERCSARRYELEELAAGLLQIANANMVQAIRSISIAKGYDPADYVLVGFGGAAPQHACDVARQLGVRHVLNHPDASLLSAYGIGLADVVRHRVAGIYELYSAQQVEQIQRLFEELAAAASAEVRAEGVPLQRITTVRSLDLRYQGLETSLNVVQPDSGTFADNYETEYQRLYGYKQQGRPIEIVAARVQVSGRSSHAPSLTRRAPRREPSSAAPTSIYFDGQWQTASVFQRKLLEPGDLITGPAMIVEQHSTTIVDPGWTAELLTGGELLLTDIADRKPATDISTQADPIQLEIFNNQFRSIAEQMGITLRQTAGSVNVKERLDFSCAIFTPGGDLVCNAPHIPVHLGAMSETVKCALADNPDLQPGDVLVTNDPYRGGSHLPDVTVVTPVHDVQGQLLFWTASRAHHAEIGGISPGSMPPFSTNLAQEGVLIRNFKLVAGGQARLDEIRDLLLSGDYPTRNVRDNLADLEAQVAANAQGARDLLALVVRYGLPVVHAYMLHIQRAAEEKMRTALRQLPAGRRQYVDHLDDGSPIAVSIDIEQGAAKIDFTGTGPVLPSNLNANRAIVTAAIMYCLRCLIAEDIPLNEGVLAPITLVLPTCLLNPPVQSAPEQCAAVVGGNVETSQRVVDALLGALGLAAASQGTMNNVMFGDATFGYYETICGGAGATAEHPGADAVHTHMTNTRLTDPEVLEQRYPVRLRRFAIRRGSGGKGRCRGGDGVLREIEFLRSLQLSVLSQRRGPYAPYGLQGGQPGDLGRNWLERASGDRQPLAALAQVAVQPGDVLIIETPGGGAVGWTL